MARDGPSLPAWQWSISIFIILYKNTAYEIVNLILMIGTIWGGGIEVISNYPVIISLNFNKNRP